MSTYQNKQDFEAALRKAPPVKLLTQAYNKVTGEKDMPTLPHEVVREFADQMYSEIKMVKNTCSIEPVMGLVLIEIELLVTPSYPDAPQEKLISNCIKRLLDSKNQVQDTYAVQRTAESIAYRDAFKSQGNVFGRNLRGAHGADFSLAPKEAVDNDDISPPEQEPQQTHNSPI